MRLRSSVKPKAQVPGLGVSTPDRRNRVIKSYSKPRPRKARIASPMDAALRQFFTSPSFAVAGASSNPAKFGHKVLCWYMDRELPVTPLNPASPTVTARQEELKTVKSPAGLESPERYALSVITPPPITQTLLEEAKKVGIRAVWLQPGTFDDKVLAYARKEWPDAAIVGTDVPGTVGGEGWCVLVDGDKGMKLAGRKPGEKL